METNEVFVTTNLNTGELWTDTIQLGALHWINQAPQEAAEIEVRVRHRAPLIKAIIHFNGNNATLKLSAEQRAITAGQSVVIYAGEVCLGGGIVI